MGFCEAKRIMINFFGTNKIRYLNLNNNENKRNFPVTVEIKLSRQNRRKSSL